MNTKSSPARTANPAGLRTNGNWSLAASRWSSSRFFLDRPFAQPRRVLTVRLDDVFNRGAAR